MRNTNKWLVLLLTVLMLVNVLGISAMAAQNPAPLDLRLVPAAEAGVVQVEILATADQTVADGKLVVTFDPEVLTYEGTGIGSAWTDAEAVTLSDNAASGKVILAFAGVDAAKEGVLFSIRFSGAACDTAITLDGSRSYITGSGTVPTVSGEFCPSDRFNDLTGLTAEGHTAVDYMVGMGYMNGMSGSKFGPHVKLNRAMMVTILHRIAGAPTVSGTNNFVDVPAGQFYTDAVIWASTNGITTGVDSTHFAPGRELTRTELVTFLYRFAGVMGYDRSATTDLSRFTDSNKVLSYAVDAFSWAVGAGIVNGTTETTLAPMAKTTRAQICLMVFRLLSQQD